MSLDHVIFECACVHSIVAQGTFSEVAHITIKGAIFNIGYCITLFMSIYGDLNVDI